MAVTTLQQAANVCLSTMNVRYLAGTLKANLTAFATALTVTANLFPDDNPDLRPIGDWFIQLQALTSQMLGVAPPNQADYALYQQALVVVYRLCWQGEDFHNAVSGPSISNAIYAAMVKAFNDNLD